MMLPLAALLLVAPARAGLFTHKSMSPDWPERQVQRELVLPRGWFALGFALDHKAAAGVRNGRGEVVPWRNGTTFQHSVLDLRFDHGFSDRVQLHLAVPFVRAHLANASGADVTTVARGDVHTAVTWQPWIGRVWATALELDLKAPSGVEWPGALVEGPGNFSSFLTGTGITNLGASLHGRVRLGDLASIGLTGTWVHKFPGIVGYVIEVDGFGNGWLDPGDALEAEGHATLQIGGDLALTATGSHSRRGRYRVASSGPSNRVRWETGTVLQKPGAYTDIGGELAWEPSPRGELAVHASNQIAGTDTRTFAHLGLEEFAPQPGLTLGGSGTIRW